MWLRWLPWRYIVRKAARARGFIDPVSVLSRLHRFAEPAEVAAPLELLRAGVVFHARGLMNTAAIQHNLDWVWPYWVERQFDPLDDAFIPRAFSITHVNLTHRNWTAIGWPDHDSLPIVDPRGLLTPFWDGWSIDAWVIDERGGHLIPSRLAHVDQRLEFEAAGPLSVVTRSDDAGHVLECRAEVMIDHGSPVCVQRVTATATGPAWLAISLRPYNPEGVSFVHGIAIQDGRRGWTIDRERQVDFDSTPDRHALSVYREGDVFARLPQATPEEKVECDVGLCTAAALFELQPGAPRSVALRIPLSPDKSNLRAMEPAKEVPSWPQVLNGHCQLRVPDERIQSLYDTAVRTLILHSPGEVYPGPYTYKRFWFRDAVFILHALLNLGFSTRVKRALDRFPSRQNRAGYFLSQEGEWDSNGAALWMFDRYCRLTGQPPDPAWESAIFQGARWIEKKRVPKGSEHAHAGLLPAGFSAEHLGPNDFYYWDDFWAIAGLQAAATTLEKMPRSVAKHSFLQTAQEMHVAIDRSLERTIGRRRQSGIPASPYRRMDSGAVGSLVGSYPLQIWSPRDPRMLTSVEFLLEHCFVHDGFFQDMIHSGVNPYLTLHVAQVLLRAGDQRFIRLMQAVANLATSTGQWPEAIHPRTLGGCMGDGQHVWAAAEWVMMLRNMFVREELSTASLVLGGGIPKEWLDSVGSVISCGPTCTPWGPITIELRREPENVVLTWNADWRGPLPRIDVQLPGWIAAALMPGANSVHLRPL